MHKHKQNLKAEKRHHFFIFVTSVFCTREGKWDTVFVLQHHPKLWCHVDIPLCLVLSRGPWPHHCHNKRWEVSTEPAGADLTEVPSAHCSEHDQFSRGKDTSLEAWQGEVLAMGANRLILSKETGRWKQSHWTGAKSSDSTVALRLTQGAFCCRLCHVLSPVKLTKSQRRSA